MNYYFNNEENLLRVIDLMQASDTVYDNNINRLNCDYVFEPCSIKRRVQQHSIKKSYH